MGRHAVTVETRCPDCGERAQWLYVAEPKGHGLRCSVSFRCASCPSALESDGLMLVDEAREAFYSSEGRWALFVRELGPHRVDALRVLRAALPNPPSEIMEIVRERRAVTKGALAELEGLAAMLEEAGAEVELRELPD